MRSSHARDAHFRLEVTTKALRQNASGKIGLLVTGLVALMSLPEGKKVDKALVDIMKNYMATDIFTRYRATKLRLQWCSWGTPEVRCLHAQASHFFEPFRTSTSTLPSWTDSRLQPWVGGCPIRHEQFPMAWIRRRLPGEG